MQVKSLKRSDLLEVGTGYKCAVLQQEACKADYQANHVR
jgi:hypothetical protein